MSTEINNIAVLTSGGDAPGMNAAIRAVVRTALYNRKRVFGVYRGYEGMIENDITELSTSSVKHILALGGTLENAVVVDGDRILSPGGLRHADEAVRHKMLDALGDMALAGAPIIGRYVGHRAGHALTNSLLRAMFLNPKCFEVVTCDHDTAALLPGAGAHLDEVCAVA